VPLLLVAEQGHGWGWTSTASIACFAIGAVGIVGFLVAEARAGDAALIPLRIFRNRTIVIALSGGFVIGAGMFGGMMTIPQYLQIVHGATPTQSGVQMLPMVLGMMIASVASGQLMSRTGRVKVFPIVGVSFMTVTLFFMSRIGADTPMWQLVVLMACFGFGLGNTMQPLTLAVQAAVDPREIGMATASATFFRQMGGTFGVAIFLSLLFNSLADNIATAFADAIKTPEFLAALKDPAVLANPTNAAFVKALASHDGAALSSVTSDSSLISALDPRLSHPFKVGFSASMDQVFLVGAIVCAVGLVVLLFLPNVKLSNRSAMAARNEMAQRKHTVTDDLVDAAAAESLGHTLDELSDAGEAEEDAPAGVAPAPPQPAEQTR